MDRQAFIEITGKSGKGRRLASRFCRSVESIKYVEGITKHVTEDMKDGVYLEEYIRRRLVTLGAMKGTELPVHFHYYFSLIPEKGFKLQTNLDLHKLALYGKEVVDPASLLSHYGTTVANM